jgi:2-amino-4-hydroxy-6-hydroxymethyldihydropteridine diphosphokinase
MKKPHKFYLNIGSNIHPEINLPSTIELLRKTGKVEAVSNAWESFAIGSNGPNFLNVSAIYLSPLNSNDLKQKIIRPIEKTLGRIRSKDKYAPRTIDIDIIMIDDKPLNLYLWNNPFVVIPLAELVPELDHPIEYKKLSLVAERMSSQTWIKRRPEVIRSMNSM